MEYLGQILKKNDRSIKAGETLKSIIKLRLIKKMNCLETVA